MPWRKWRTSKSAKFSKNRIKEGTVIPCDARTIAHLINVIRYQWCYQVAILDRDEAYDATKNKRDLEPVVEYFERLLFPRLGRGENDGSRIFRGKARTKSPARDGSRIFRDQGRFGISRTPEKSTWPCIIAHGTARGTALIHKYFSPGKISAVDPDEGLVAVSRETLANLPVDIASGSLTRLGYRDASFDAVFVLGELHNYPEWWDCVGEIARVTKPGGFFFIEELSAESFEYALGRYFRAKTDHRYDAMLRLDEFRDAVQAAGFELLRLQKRKPFGLFSYFVMAAKKRP